MAEAAVRGGTATLRQAMRDGGRALRAADIDDPMLDAGLLLGYATGCDRLALLRDGGRCLTDREAVEYDRLITARATGQPVSRLLGRREFWSLDLQISPAVLDPRPDSETVVAAALDLLPDENRPYRLADFGTGSGCLLLALVQERPKAWGVGLDISAAAARLAQDNARALGLAGRAAFLAADWGGALDGRFDLIVANPPYIATADIAFLAPEVRCHDPHSALDGGADGLAAYAALLPDLRRLLRPAGHAALECGQGQAPALMRMAATAGFRDVRCHRDLAGIERCLTLSLV